MYPCLAQYCTTYVKKKRHSSPIPTAMDSFLKLCCISSFSVLLVRPKDFILWLAGRRVDIGFELVPPSEPKKDPSLCSDEWDKRSSESPEIVGAAMLSPAMLPLPFE